MTLSWQKILSASDAQRPTDGSLMPFLRLTGGEEKVDYPRWFREVFFASLYWKTTITPHGFHGEEAEVDIHVTITGKYLGLKRMRLDQIPNRHNNNHSPTAYLYYDTDTRLVLESTDLTGHFVVLDSDATGYHLSIL